MDFKSFLNPHHIQKMEITDQRFNTYREYAILDNWPSFIEWRRLQLTTLILFLCEQFYVYMHIIYELVM